MMAPMIQTKLFRKRILMGAIASVCWVPAIAFMLFMFLFMLPEHKVLLAHGGSHGSPEPQPEKSLMPLAEPTIVPDSSPLKTMTVEKGNPKSDGNDWQPPFGLGETALLLLVLCPISLFTLKGQLHRRKI